jgi:hypothetical protein
MTNNLRLVPAIAGLLAWFLTPTNNRSPRSLMGGKMLH